MRPPTIVDFETEPIRPRPKYPPRPVGCAVREPGKKPRYLAWGHPTANNIAERDAKRQLNAIWRAGGELVMHHAAFDLDVGETHLGLKPPPVERVHCTMLEAFLYDPNEKELGLKPLAQSWLGIEPTERDELRDWILANVPEARKRKKQWGEYIYLAPGDLVGRYACADVTLTGGIHGHCYPLVGTQMKEAYERERKLLRILLRMGRRGIPVDADGLAEAITTWERSVAVVDRWIAKRLKVKELDVDSHDELADALERAGKISRWVMTAPTKAHPDGQRSTSMTALETSLNDPELLNVLRYRARVANSLRTFARPWLEMAAETGHIYVVWNQVRQAASADGGRQVGARTGRLSSQPNVMNVPRVPGEIVFTRAELERAEREADAKDLPKPLLLPAELRGKISPLPNLRDFVIGPGPRGLLLDRDYSQQELRILGHFEGEALKREYNADPWMDLHQRARELINGRTGRNFGRKPIKNTGFGIIYGMGVGKMAWKIGESVETARLLKNEYLSAFPGLRKLNFALKRAAALGRPITTWGGRLNFCEPPVEIDGELRTFEYKLLNTLIQGSAADNTKQAMINYDETRRDGELFLQIHDQIVAGTEDPKAAPGEMRRLREAMEACEFDVPMLSEGDVGRRWASAAPFDRKGKEIGRG